MKQIRRIKIEVEVNVLPHETPKEVVDRVGRIFAYYTGSGTLEAVVRCYALAPNGDELINGAQLLEHADDGLSLLEIEESLPGVDLLGEPEIKSDLLS